MLLFTRTVLVLKPILKGLGLVSESKSKVSDRANSGILIKTSQDQTITNVIREKRRMQVLCALPGVN